MCKCNCNIFSVSLHYTNQQPSHSHFCSLWWSNYIRCRIVDETGTELNWQKGMHIRNAASQCFGGDFFRFATEREIVRRKDGQTSSWLRCVSPLQTEFFLHCRCPGLWEKLFVVLWYFLLLIFTGRDGYPAASGRRNRNKPTKTGIWCENNFFLTGHIMEVVYVFSA